MVELENGGIGRMELREEAKYPFLRITSSLSGVAP
jgi:hypothetical protein